MAHLSEDSDPYGENDSVYSHEDANLFPLTDSASDAETSADNVLSLTLDLKSCLNRVSLGTGDYQITLQATGESFRGGSNRAAQTIFVRVQ